MMDGGDTVAELNVVHVETTPGGAKQGNVVESTFAPICLKKAKEIFRKSGPQNVSAPINLKRCSLGFSFSVENPFSPFFLVFRPKIIITITNCPLPSNIYAAHYIHNPFSPSHSPSLPPHALFTPPFSATFTPPFPTPSPSPPSGAAFPNAPPPSSRAAISHRAPTPGRGSPSRIPAP